MITEKTIWIMNRAVDDIEAGLVHLQENDDVWRIIVRTNTGVDIITKSFVGDIQTPTNAEIEFNEDESDFDFGFTVVLRDGNHSFVGLSEDGDVVYNPDNIDIEDISFYAVGNSDELAELIEDDEVSDDVYDALDSIGCLL